mgnify:CR=1 FL=1
MQNTAFDFIREYLHASLEKTNERYKCILRIMLFTALLAYCMLIITGVTCPDGLCEGYTYYTGADWASRNGRWAIRYLNLLTGNIVIPIYTVSMYCLCISIVVLMLTDLFKIRKRVSVIFITAAMTASPSITAQFLYTYMALAYGVSCLLSTFFVWILHRGKGRYKYVLAAGSMAVSLGMYQSYVGFSVLLITMLLVTELLTYVPWCVWGGHVAKFAICGCGGCILYLLIMKIDLKVRNLSAAGRVGAFNIKVIIKSLLQSTGKNAYQNFGNYFKDTVLHRNFLYFSFITISVLLLCTALIKLYKQHKYMNIFVIIILILLMPLAANTTEILIPGSISYIVMQYQYVLIIPFFTGIAEHINPKIRILHFFKTATCIICGLIAWTYIISANATYTCYKLSYSHINFETSLVLSEIYRLPDYVPSETTIIFAGFPNADELVEQIPTYKYAVHYTDNPVFWEDINGATGNRRSYLMHYFGIDGKSLDMETYENIAGSDEFKKMAVWPADGSVKMINETAVVKFTEHPPGVQQ